MPAAIRARQAHESQTGCRQRLLAALFDAGSTLKTEVVSVADETCAILAFGGALAALTYARTTGIDQRIDCSLLGGQIA